MEITQALKVLNLPQMTRILSPIRWQNLQVRFTSSYVDHISWWTFLPILFLDDEDVPIKKNKNRKNERDEIMAVIRKNPEDFGVRRSSRGPPTLSESSNDDDDGSSSDSSEDFKPIKK